MSEKLVIGLAGMPGAGKSIVATVAKDNGYDIVVMGDVIREEAKKRGLEPNPENLGKIMLELRQKEGNAVVAKRSLQRIENSKKPKIIVDGIRSLSEVAEFKKHFPKFTLIAVEASTETRFKRLYHRKRSDDPKSWKIFHERDRRELNVGLGEAITTAKYKIRNEEKKAIVKEKVEQILKKVETQKLKTV